MDAHEALATSGSVPFATRLTGPGLRAILSCGVVSDDFWPHLNRALTELPLDMVAGVIHEHPAGPVREAAAVRGGGCGRGRGEDRRLAAWLIPFGAAVCWRCGRPGRAAPA